MIYAVLKQNIYPQCTVYPPLQPWVMMKGDWKEKQNENRFFTLLLQSALTAFPRNDLWRGRRWTALTEQLELSLVAVSADRFIYIRVLIVIYPGRSAETSVNHAVWHKTTDEPTAEMRVRRQCWGNGIGQPPPFSPWGAISHQNFSSRFDNNHPLALDCT